MEYLADLHHKVIHFPIAFLFIYPFIEVISLFYKNEKINFTSLIILILGILFSLIAVLTGNQIFNSITDMSPELYSLAEQHYTNANIVVWLFTFILFARIYLQAKNKYFGKWKIILLIVAFIGCYFIYKTGELGNKTAKTRFSKEIMLFPNEK